MDGSGGAYPPMRPGAGGTRHVSRVLGLVLKAGAGRLSYAAVVSGLVDNPCSADISQSELGDFSRQTLDEIRRPALDEFCHPDHDEFRRPVFDENHRINAADLSSQSPNAVALLNPII